MTGVNIDQLIAEIRLKVEERRASGDYPPGLEEELKLQFETIVRSNSAEQQTIAEQLKNLKSNVESTIETLTHRRLNSSREMKERRFFRSKNRLTSRQVRLDTQEIEEMLAGLSRAVVKIMEMQALHGDADARLVDHLAKSVLEHLAVVDHLAVLIVDLEKRINILRLGS